MGNPSEYGVQPVTRKGVVRSGVPDSGSASQDTGEGCLPSGSGRSDHGEIPVPIQDESQSVPFVPIQSVPSVPVSDVPYFQSRGESHSLVENQYRVTGGKTNTEIPIDNLIPRNTVGDVVEDAVPSYSPCPDVLPRPNSPLFSYLKPNQIVSGHLPRYAEVKKQLSLIKQKCLRDFNIPLKAAEIKREYPNSLYFSDIYRFLKSGELPSWRRRSSAVMRNSENFILIQDLLFRIS